MKLLPNKLNSIPLLLALASPLVAQSPGELPPAPPAPASSPEAGPDEALPASEDLPPFDDYLPEPAAAESDLPPVGGSPVPPPSAPSAAAGVPLDEQIPVAAPAISGDSGDYQLTDANLNDVFTLLAENAHRQFFHNPRIAGDEFKVTGRLSSVSPLKRMEELAFAYGLEMYEKGNTVYALTKDQITDLPSEEWYYQLRYLRPKDIERIQSMVSPYLSPGTGIVNYEPKTNTIVVIDIPKNIERVENFFKKVDVPQEQVVVEVKILSVNSTAVSRLGTNWASTLGATGLGLDTIADLGAVFGVSSGATAAATGSDSKFVLSPFELNGVIRALNEGSLVDQKSNPVLITENNEQATISIIDRVPIITTQTNQGTGGTTITEEIRYTIDENDPVNDPEATREIGISVSVTPTVNSQDGTIRLDMRPRSAQIVEFIEGVTGNQYPRVAESMVDTIATIPNGHSLIIGGFYNEVTSKDGTKVPWFGDLPLLNFLFKSKESSKESSSLIFVVTPTSYSAENHARNYATSERLREKYSLPSNHDTLNGSESGPAHEADYCRTMRSIRKDIKRDTANAHR